MFHPALKAQVIVNTKTDQAFKGVLWKATRTYVLLKNAALLGPNGKEEGITGEVLVDRANLDFIVITRS